MSQRFDDTPSEPRRQGRPQWSHIGCAILLAAAAVAFGVWIWSGINRKPQMRALFFDGTELSRAEVEKLGHLSLPDGVTVEHSWMVSMSPEDVLFFTKLAVPRGQVHELIAALQEERNVSSEDRLEGPLTHVENLEKPDWWHPEEIGPEFTAVWAGPVWLIMDDRDTETAEAYMLYVGG